MHPVDLFITGYSHYAIEKNASKEPYQIRTFYLTCTIDICMFVFDYKYK